MAIIDGGNNSAGKANVDNGFNLTVTLPTVDAYAGKARMMSENDAGGLRSGTPYLKSPETSSDYRLRVGLDNLLFEDAFNATAQNTNLWSYVFNTLTCTQPGVGTLNFGTVQGTTSSHGAYMRTFQYFPVVNTAPLAIEFDLGSFNSQLVAGEVFLAGLGNPSAATTRPTDGIWWKFTTSGLEGIIAYNGNETSMGIVYPFASFSQDITYNLTMIVAESEVELWLNDQLVADYELPAGNPLPFLTMALPVFIMKYNTGTVSNTNTMRVARVAVTLMDMNSNRAWGSALAIQSRSAYVGQNGFTMGSTAGQFGTTAAIPGTFAGSNTAPNAAYAGLGGLFQMTAQAGTTGTSGDMVAQYYLNPASTVNITGRNLVITGMKISTMNFGATIATTPTALLWGVAYGHITNTLAATETASFATATTHAPRHVALGIQAAPIGAVVGATYSPDVVVDFSSAPIIVRPGEYISATVRFIIGTATALQTIIYMVTYLGYFE